MNQKIKEGKSIDILNRVAKRIEDATVDIHSIKYDLKAMKLEMMGLQSNSAIMKVDMEKMREELREGEERLGKRISNVADLITVSMDQKLKTAQKRISKLEQLQQTL